MVEICELISAFPTTVWKSCTRLLIRQPLENGSSAGITLTLVTIAFLHDVLKVSCTTFVRLIK